MQPDALAPDKTITLYEHGVLMPGGEVEDEFDVPF